MRSRQHASVSPLAGRDCARDPRAQRVASWLPCEAGVRLAKAAEVLDRYNRLSRRGLYPADFERSGGCECPLLTPSGVSPSDSGSFR
jgi:hypothetical protein